MCKRRYVFLLCVHLCFLNTHTHTQASKQASKQTMLLFFNARQTTGVNNGGVFLCIGKQTHDFENKSYGISLSNIRSYCAEK